MSDDRDRRSADLTQASAQHWYESAPPAARALSQKLRAATEAEAKHAEDLAAHADGALEQLQHRAEVTQGLAREALRRVLEGVGLTDQFLRDISFSLVVAHLNEIEALAAGGVCHCARCATGRKLSPGQLTAALHGAQATVRSAPHGFRKSLTLVKPKQETNK